ERRGAAHQRLSVLPPFFSRAARKKNKSPAVIQAVCSMSISAAVALSSHINDMGRIRPATNPAVRPKRRPKYQANNSTQAVAASADGSRAVNSVTFPNGRLHSMIAQYMPGGLVNNGSPYR